MRLGVGTAFRVASSRRPLDETTLFCWAHRAHVLGEKGAVTSDLRTNPGCTRGAFPTPTSCDRTPVPWLRFPRAFLRQLAGVWNSEAKVTYCSQSGELPRTFQERTSNSAVLRAGTNQEGTPVGKLRLLHQGRPLLRFT